MSEEKPPKFMKGQVVSSRVSPPLRINSSYFSAFSGEHRYFGSYIGRDGKVMAHNDRTVGTGESSLIQVIAPSLKDYRRNLTASQRMEKMY